MINLKSLNRYLGYYTSIKVEKSGSQVKIGKHILDIGSKHTAMVIYLTAIADMIENHEFGETSIYYFRDLITSFLKEVAKQEGIDPGTYRWSTDLLRICPEYSIFYNMVDGFILGRQCNRNSELEYKTREDEMLAILNETFDKYCVTDPVKKKEKLASETKVGPQLMRNII